MKTVIVVFAVLVSSLSFAQPGGREKLTPEQNVEKRLKEMTNDLSLTEKQQIEIKAILVDLSKKREAKRAEIKANREKGEKISDEQKADMKKRMIDEQLEMKIKLKKILTEEQLKKMKEVHKEKREDMGERKNKDKKPVEK